MTNEQARDQEESDEVLALKAALREAILNTRRTTRRCSPDDEDESIIEWRSDVQEWAALCDLDLSQHNPFYYGDRYR